MKTEASNTGRLFGNKVRLGIMSSLAVNPWLDFNALKEYLGVTDGNLAGHLKALEHEGLLRTEKSFIGKKPNTRYTMTAPGRKVFAQHLLELESRIGFQEDPPDS